MAELPAGRELDVEGPYFDELAVGQTFSHAPAITLTEGLAAAHQAILGDRLALPLDHESSRAVTGSVLAHPGLVCDIAIGQSTIVTQHVKANLFYRRLALLRSPSIGDTLRTVTRVVGLRQNSARAGRAATGLVALHMSTTDSQGRQVLDFYRCAMLPLRDPSGRTAHAHDLSAIGTDGTDPDPLVAAVGWDLVALTAAFRAAPAADLRAGAIFRIVGGDVVSSAPELARLTLNIAAAHHDEAVGGRRLVYGGHTIGLALAQAGRAVPRIATVLSWRSCDHLGPVYEGDTLRSTLSVESVAPSTRGGSVVGFRSLVSADGPSPRPVLDWRFVALVA